MIDNSKMISVVIPVYNVEKYLERCVKSVVEQTYENLEIILVDDGSTDSSGELCDKIALTDDRIKVIHKENGGLSSARNAGIEVANGDYIGFVDSDDYIEKDMYLTLIAPTYEHDVDMCSCTMKDVYSSHVVNFKYEHNAFYCNGKDAYRYILQGKYIPISVCPKIFSRAVMEKARFAIGKYYEDFFFVAEVMPYVKTVWTVGLPLYCYYHRDDSITTCDFSNRHIDVIRAAKKNYDIVKKLYPDMGKECAFRMYRTHFQVLDKMMMSDNYESIEEYDKVVSFLRKNWFRIVCMEYFTTSRRIGAVLLRIDPKLYYLLLRLKERRDSTND
ncbi:glycosyltransferase [uncultured Ruminococcus sp.]|uniref:glycosyltransferase family 2 protein n=1 Tax=uncultured Ruminococcus sp. TaxID=165186 RepID=UPI0025CFA67A|nr:glycosyltransferase [uncultured Ruminococcus sp.]